MRGGERLFFRQVHLAMKNVEAFDAKFGGFIDHGFDGNFFGFEMPIGIGGDAEFDAFVARGSGRLWFMFFSAESEGGAKRSRAGEEGASIPRLVIGDWQSVNGN